MGIINKMNSARKISIGFSFLIIIAATFVGFFLINNQRHVPQVKIGGEIIKVDLAITTREQEQGLSGRSGLSANTGMLFIFDHSGKYPFWMKDMNFPIDMIWLSESGEIIYIKKNALPDSYPQAFGPNKDAKYVLEVAPGFSDRTNLKEGDKAEIIK